MNVSLAPFEEISFNMLFYIGRKPGPNDTVFIDKETGNFWLYEESAAGQAH